MKAFIYECVEKKVADKIAAAEKARMDQKEKDSKTLKAVEDYAKSLIPDATKKVIAFAKKQGLTWLEYRPTWSRIKEHTNVAFSATVDSYDFEETNQHDNNTSAARKARMEIEDKPEQIKKAVNKATNAIVFALELGKVKKAELDDLIATTEIEI